MILCDGAPRRTPAIFKTMTGLSVALFDEVVDDLAPAYAPATYDSRNRPERRRAVSVDLWQIRDE